MSELHGGVGSYVVDALESEEREEFEAHLAACPTCRQEVAEFSETAAELSRLTAVPSPPELGATILRSIREVRPLPPVVEQSGADPTPSLVGPSELRPIENQPEPSDELTVRRARRSRWLTAAVAAALVVALALGGWVYALTQQRQAQVAQEQVAQQQAAAQERAETELLSAPDVRVVGVQLNGASASFAVSKSLNRAMFFGSDLPSPGAGRTYQLWTVDPRAEAPQPDALVQGGTTRVFLRNKIRDAVALAVSIEPAGGSQKPTNILVEPTSI